MWFEGEAAGKVCDLNLLSVGCEEGAFFYLDGDAGVVAHMLVFPGESIEEGGFSGVGIAYEGDGVRLGGGRHGQGVVAGGNGWLQAGQTRIWSASLRLSAIFVPQTVQMRLRPLESFLTSIVSQNPMLLRRLHAAPRMSRMRKAQPTDAWLSVMAESCWSCEAMSVGFIWGRVNVVENRLQ